MAMMDEPIDLVHSKMSQLGVDDHCFFAEPLWTVDDVADYLQLNPKPFAPWRAGVSCLPLNLEKFGVFVGTPSTP